MLHIIFFGCIFATKSHMSSIFHIILSKILMNEQDTLISIWWEWYTISILISSLNDINFIEFHSIYLYLTISKKFAWANTFGICCCCFFLSIKYRFSVVYSIKLSLFQFKHKNKMFVSHFSQSHSNDTNNLQNICSHFQIVGLK